MNKYLLLAFALVISAFAFAHEEDDKFSCTTPEMNKRALENDPEAVHRRAQLQSFVRNYINENHREDETYIIPVVFHIVHDNGVENISEEQVKDAVRIITRDFRKQNEDTSMIIADFKPIAADTKIEFRLARKDPNGECTSGITRTRSAFTASAGENVKDVAQSWPRAMYLNVWVVRNIASGAAGYAYYPGSVGDGRDGILLKHNYVGSIGTASASRSRTLTHEIGHYLGLAHPWGSTNEPGLSTNCDIDDGIEDTPNTIGHTSCDLNSVTCGSLDNVQNYMDYSYCSRMFTYGQKDYMRGVLNSYTSDRNNLWTEENLIATGVNDENQETICAPIAEFNYNKTIGCEGLQIEFEDKTYNTDVIDTYNWTFEGGTPASSNEENPTITYSIPGEYSVTLHVVNTAGNSEIVKNDIIRILPNDVGSTIPFFDNIEAEDFPNSFDNINGAYIFEKANNVGWQRTKSAAFSGKYSLMLDSRFEDEDSKNSFITPSIVVENPQPNLSLRFRIAHSSAEKLKSGRLKISYSKTCGETWSLFSLLTGSLLQTAETPHENGAFLPEPNEWSVRTIDLPSFFYSEDVKSVKFKFEMQTDEGNRLYIDDIELGYFNNINTIDISDKFAVYPVPFNDLLILETTETGEAEISIFDMTGILINKQKISLNQRNDLTQMASDISKGIYMVEIKTEKGTAIKKISKY